MDACKDGIGISKRINKPWISATTLEKIENRKSIKGLLNDCRTRKETAKHQKNYSGAHNIVKKGVKADKKRFFQDMAAKAETAAENRNMKELYDITRLLSNKKSSTTKPIKDKSGKVLTTSEEQLVRWKEHFMELLNRQPPDNRANIPPAENTLPINCSVPTKDEIRQAIKSLKNNKAAGPDGIPPEALKADIDTSTEILYSLLGKIWNEEKIPQDWKDGHVVVLPKKGDLSQCKNYRGIMLLSTPGKVLNKIILERMKKTVDKLLRDEQAGFRQNRSCTDQIATLRLIIEQSLEWNSSLYINFIDFEKAFDSLDRLALWDLLRHYGIPAKLIRLMQEMYTGMKCQVRHDGQLTEKFCIETGVRQGCLLSPFLFIVAIDWLMKESTKNKRNGIQWTLTKQLDDLDFADDLALLSHTHSQMQDKTNILNCHAKQIGLRIHTGKTKIMKINPRNNTSIELENQEIEEVDKFTYLGSNVDTEGGSDRDISIRIGKARSAFVLLNNIWRTNGISRATKIRLFNSNVKSVLFYGAETWRTTASTEKKIQVFVNKCLRKILGIWWPNKISNDNLWRLTNQLPPIQELRKRKWKWVGHTLRKEKPCITQQALRWNPQGKRRRGRPRNTWRRNTEKQMGEMGYSWGDIERLAQNRVRWKSVVGGLYSKSKITDYVA